MKRIVRQGVGVVAGFAFSLSAALAQQLPVPPQSNPVAELGRQLFFDTNLSEPRGLACAGCHDPARAFSGDNGSGIGVPVGSRPDQFGPRKAPTIMYLASAPALSIERKRKKRIPRGGMFWDGRVNSLEEQAAKPFMTAHEMNLSSAEDLAARVATAAYAEAFKKQFGNDIFADADRTLVAVTAAIGAFERTPVFAPFTSKFDAVVRGRAKFTAAEDRGYKFFTIGQKGNCVECHAIDVDSEDPRDYLFTNFGYHALGVPRNDELPTNASADDFDLGLCKTLRERPEIESPDDFCGWFKVPTLRNITLTGPYMHNGYFKTLREAVAFYATRDTNPDDWYPADAKFNDLPARYHANVDRKTRPYHRKPGKRPALKDEEIDDIVAFLHTLTDGYEAETPTGAAAKN